jgi:transcriptional regulator with XRE-family HTH domain
VSAVSGGHAAEQYLPENLRALRERQGVSQAALAEAMSHQGWPWHQQTVYKVENGKQGVGFGEATDLAAILGVSADRLTWSGPEANEAALVDRATAILRQSWEEAAGAIVRLHAARAGADRTLGHSEDSKYARVREACGDLRNELDAATLDAAVDEGMARWEQEA